MSADILRLDSANERRTKRLFHVSEDPNITTFHPRLPTRTDLDPTIALVWAIDEARLPNFLTPRNCPRVAYNATDKTTDADRKRFFTSSRTEHAVILESKWLPAMLSTTLYLYEFDPAGFILQDDVAGYYVATETQFPILKHVIPDPLSELLRRSVEVRFVNSLWDAVDAVQASTLNWSLCRMAYAQPRE